MCNFGSVIHISIYYEGLHIADLPLFKELPSSPVLNERFLLCVDTGHGLFERRILYTAVCSKADILVPIIFVVIQATWSPAKRLPTLPYVLLILMLTLWSPSSTAVHFTFCSLSVYIVLMHNENTPIQIIKNLISQNIKFSDKEL